MLAETIAYATSYFATPEPFRPHINEAVGLWSRGRRQAQAWGPHAGETSRSITGLMETLPTHRTVAVLGSGPLFDVPVEALAARFARVILVDRAHLSPARRRTRRLSNVRHDWRDLSTATTADPLGFLAAIPDLDWVISVNLASQLGVDAPFGQERRVIEAHLADLTRLPCPVTVVTDISFRTVDRAGREHERFDLMHGHPMPRPARTWHWEVAPHGEENRVTRREHVVAFYPDWHEASRRKP
ncbi:hypothetical protein GCM10011321_39180 [Youhaiella tibetensis]|uniref:Uncharacterized protein n=1 Tax=Paradevosia tibetensis TaxID=1447062 RepID=A0A5B9DRU9_9HYPH|nr:hypothetical protein [Youhaiella tibetensis]QEE22151.1 hypothetical protein FNA67_19160 [Youhaiella tibetensis]GGF44779.1 hypothetical protein GCM10011321_39180 [Youhaiella tibetensis]